MSCRPPSGNLGLVPLSYDSVHLRLVEAVPEFEVCLAEHLEHQEGEVLPHVLFGELTQFVLDAYHRGSQDLVLRSLGFLDGALRDGDAMVQNLVAVSFVEKVGPWDAAAQDFIATWPVALRAEAERQRTWQPGEAGR